MVKGSIKMHEIPWQWPPIGFLCCPGVRNGKTKHRKRNRKRKKGGGTGKKKYLVKVR